MTSLHIFTELLRSSVGAYLEQELTLNVLTSISKVA